MKLTVEIDDALVREHVRDAVVARHRDHGDRVGCLHNRGQRCCRCARFPSPLVQLPKEKFVARNALHGLDEEALQRMVPPRPLLAKRSEHLVIAQLLVNKLLINIIIKL